MIQERYDNQVRVGRGIVEDVLKKAMAQGRIATPGHIGSVYFAAARMSRKDLSSEHYQNEVYAAVPLLPTLLGEWVRECAYQQAPIHHSTIDKLVKIEAKDIVTLSAEYETLLLHSGVAPEEFFKRDVILDRLVVDSQDLLKKVWE